MAFCTSLGACEVCKEPFPGLRGAAFRYQNDFAMAVQAIPFIVGGLSFLWKVLPKNPQERNWLYERFCQCKEEMSVGFSQETALVVAKILAVGVSFAVSSAYLSYHPLSIGSFQFPKASLVALSGTILACFFLQGRKWKETLVTAFTFRRDHAVVQERLRIAKNVALSILGIGGAVTVASLMPQILKRSTQYQLWLPYQTKPVVFLEYVAVGLAHGACAFTSIQKQKNLQGIYHSLNALMTSIFPVLYLFYPPLRVHHSLYGAIFKLIPSLNMKLLGAVLTASSLAYIGFSPQSPGYESYMQCPRRGKMEQVLHVYGLDNVLLDRLHVVLLGICGLCLEALGTALSSHLYKEELVQQKPSMDSVV